LAAKHLLERRPATMATKHPPEKPIWPGRLQEFGARERCKLGPSCWSGLECCIWRSSRITKRDHNGMANGLMEIRSHVEATASLYFNYRSQQLNMITS
jgi:hypothetical protein